MNSSHYRPRRSQQLFLLEKLRERYNWDTNWRIVVHHVLEDTPTRLLLQIERSRLDTPQGIDNAMLFERVEL